MAAQLAVAEGLDGVVRQKRGPSHRRWRSHGHLAGGGLARCSVRLCSGSWPWGLQGVVRQQQLPGRTLHGARGLWWGARYAPRRARRVHLCGGSLRKGPGVASEQQHRASRTRRGV